MQSAIVITILFCISTQQISFAQQANQASKAKLNRLTSMKACQWGIETPGLATRPKVDIVTREESIGDSEAAAKQYRELVASLVYENGASEKIAFLQLKLAKNLLKTKQWREAEPVLQETLRLCDANAPVSVLSFETYCLWTEFHTKSGQTDQAQKFLELAIERAPNSFRKNDVFKDQVMYLEGKISLAEQRYEVAAEKFIHSLELLREKRRIWSPLLDHRHQQKMKRKRLADFDGLCQIIVDSARSNLPFEAYCKNIIQFKGQVDLWRRGKSYWQKCAGFVALKAEYADLQKKYEQLFTEGESFNVELEQECSKRATLLAQKMNAWADAYGLDQLGSTESDYSLLQAVLKPDETFLDFVAYRRGAEPHLFALIVRKDKPLRCVDLGESKSLADNVLKWNAGQGESVAAQKAGLAIRKKIWEPIAEHIGTKDNVIVSPDGIVGFIAFGALPSTQPGRFLIEDHLFVHETSAIAMISARRKKAVSPTRPDDREMKWLALGNPLFGTQPTENRNCFSQLPGTQTEVEALDELLQEHFPNAEWTELSGADATANELVSRLRGKSHIHLATHGYHKIPDDLTPEIQAERQLFSHDRCSRYAGLAFAKTEQAPLASRLNAEEIQSLDLASVRLVVLSGCETGLGVWDQGDGMASLQQAFHIAGAQSVIASLWHLPDGPSSELMNRFYLNLLEQKMNRGEALRRAQIWMLRHRQSCGNGNRNVVMRDIEKRSVPSDPNAKVASPFLWGGYVISGSYR